MDPNPNPIFVFIPGAWHTPDTFDIVRDVLAKRGYESEAVPNVSVGATDTSFGLLADVAHTKSVIQTLADQGRRIVVVNHSYGGLVGAGAVEGLGLKQRAQAGLSGGVIQVVWMAAFVAPKGMSVIDMLGGDYLPWMLLKVRASLYRFRTEDLGLIVMTVYRVRIRMMGTVTLLRRRRYSIMI